MDPLIISTSFLLLTTSNWFSFSALLHFACRFPPDRDILKERKSLIGYIYLVPPAIVLAAALLTASLSSEFWVRLQQIRNIMLPVIITLVFAKEWHDYKAMDVDEKKRFKPLLLTFWITFGPYLFLYLLPVTFFDRPYISFHLVTVCFLALPIAYLYSVVRYRLFDADKLLSRFISYAILAGMVLIFYSVFLVAIKRWLFGSGMLSEELFFVYLVASVLAFYPVQRRMELLVRKVFFRYRPVPAEVMHQFSDKITGTLFLSDIIGAIIDRLR